MKTLLHFILITATSILLFPKTIHSQVDPLLTYIHPIDPTIGVNRYLSRAVQCHNFNFLFHKIDTLPDHIDPCNNC
ncbi:MAG: hypothetical protein AAF544_05705, partial [Bacteroidota bacterium]